MVARRSWALLGLGSPVYLTGLGNALIRLNR